MIFAQEACTSADLNFVGGSDVFARRSKIARKNFHHAAAGNLAVARQLSWQRFGRLRQILEGGACSLHLLASGPVVVFFSRWGCS